MKDFMSSPLRCCLQTLLFLPLASYLQASSLLAQPMVRKVPASTASPSPIPLPSPAENKTNSDNEQPPPTPMPMPTPPPQRRSIQLCPVGTCAASRPTGGGGGVLIIHQHVGRLVSGAGAGVGNHTHDRYALEGPFLAVVVIGSIFLVLTVISILVSFVFLKKQNKVFSLAAAGGEVLGHASQARHLEEAVVVSDGYSISDSFQDISEESMIVELPPEENEEEERRAREPGSQVVVIANNSATARHITFCNAHSLNPVGRQSTTAGLTEFTATFVNSGTVQNFEV